ncbi:hypothetical protein PORY_000684, partial [Pneumocystis oryctolagi]
SAYCGGGSAPPLQPEWFYRYVLERLIECEPFLRKEVQCLVGEEQDVMEGFIECLMQVVVEEKIKQSVKEALKEVHLFSHFVRETVKFEEVLWEEFGWRRGEEGVLGAMLGEEGVLEGWIELEKAYSMGRLEAMMEQGVSGEGWGLDYESVGEGETKPTGCSLRVRGLIESLTGEGGREEISHVCVDEMNSHTWSSLENPSSSMTMSCPVSVEMVDALTLTDSMLNFLKRALSHLAFLKIYRQFSLNVENLLWNKIILKNTFSVRGGTQFSRDMWEFWAVCSRYVEKPEQNMKKIEDASVLLSLRSSDDHHEKSISTVGSVIFDLYKSLEEKTQYLRKIGVKHISVAETRSILQRRIDCWAQ